jgi:DNA-binding CsgD family transcriptional regulator
MTREEAIALRARQLQGEPVSSIQLAQAMEVIRVSAIKPPRPDVPRRGNANKGAPFELSNQQLAIVKGLAGGATAPEVAQCLGCTESAVRTQMHRIRLKMDTQTPKEAVAKWRRLFVEPVGEAA